MSLVQGLPFLGLLLSIALLPGLAPRFWLRRMGWVSLGWSLALVAFLAVARGPHAALATAWRALLVDYLPFVSLLGALYTASGGVRVRGGLAGTPTGNTITLAAGMVAGLVMGTTGAAMVLIQPLLRANAHRTRKTHLVLFVIVLVGNVSGALTPLGNPPLFMGLLRGVPFFWPARHLLAPYLVVSLVLLGMFWLVDRWLARSDPPAPSPGPLRIDGWANIALVLMLGVSVLAQGLPLPDLSVLGQPVGSGRLAGVAVAAAAIAMSLRITPRRVHRANDFAWHPMIEVAVLFAGIFVTLAPVSEMLHAGLNGPLAGVLRLTQDSAGQPIPLVYFWLTGLLSAFLDNAPTFLVFFDLAGIRPEAPSDTLVAISAGAVFFGGLTYIGNAPNLMLRAIAAHRGVRMPGFIGFFLLASALLMPVSVLVSLIFFI